MTEPAAPETPAAPAAPETPAEAPTETVTERLEREYHELEAKARDLLVALGRMAGRAHLSLNAQEAESALIDHVTKPTAPPAGDADPTETAPAPETAEQAAGESDPTPEAEPAAPTATDAPAATPEADPPAAETPEAPS